MKIRPVGAELFHADRRRDRHDEANRRFSQNYEKRLKTSPMPRVLSLSRIRQTNKIQINDSYL